MNHIEGPESIRTVDQVIAGGGYHDILEGIISDMPAGSEETSYQKGHLKNLMVLLAPYIEQNKDNVLSRLNTLAKGIDNNASFSLGTDPQGEVELILTLSNQD